MPINDRVFVLKGQKPGASRFADRYCQRHGIAPERFMRSVLRRSVPWHVRPLLPLIGLFRPMHFTADYDFIEAVGWLREQRDYQFAVREFSEHPANRGFLRRWLRLRVSVGRVSELVREIQGKIYPAPADEANGGSVSPFCPSEEAAGDSQSAKSPGRRSA